MNIINNSVMFNYLLFLGQEIEIKSRCYLRKICYVLCQKTIDEGRRVLSRFNEKTRVFEW
jgi:hypothetical protein